MTGRGGGEREREREGERERAVSKATLGKRDTCVW